MLLQIFLYMIPVHTSGSFSRQLGVEVGGYWIKMAEFRSFIYLFFTIFVPLVLF